VKLRLLAPAKLNLTLEVLGRRNDGFHEIRSVIQAISHYDVVEAEPARDTGLVCPEGPSPDENLAPLAATGLRTALGLSEGASLRLYKRIPAGAGLGGGSSDAAAVLRLLSRLWRTRLAPSKLRQLAASLGSDVPFFLSGGAALASGRGERIERLPALRSGHVVLVVPPWQMPGKTARVFSAVTTSDYSDGQVSLALAGHLKGRHRLECCQAVNNLTPAARRVFPALADLEARLESLTGAHFRLCGAGPSLFHMAASGREAARVARLAGQVEMSVYVARTLSGPTRIRAIGQADDEPLEHRARKPAVDR